MKKILVFLVLTAVVSCSKDDDSNDNQNGGDPAVETALYLTSAKVEFTNSAPANVTFGYNDDKELTDMDINDVHYDITYQNGYIKTFKYDNNNVEFTYTNNIVTSIVTNGVADEVVYDSEDNKYSLSNSSYTLNQYGDLSLSSFPNSSMYYSYDTAKKGAIFNYPIKNPFWVFALIGGSPIFSIKPCTSYGTIEIENTFNSDGYLSKAVYRDAGVLASTATYTYGAL